MGGVKGMALANYHPGLVELSSYSLLEGGTLDRFAFRVPVMLGTSELRTSPEVPAFALALLARG